MRSLRLRCDNLDTHVHVAPCQPDLAPETVQRMKDSVPRKIEKQKDQHAAVDRFEDPSPPKANVNTKEKATAASVRSLKKHLSDTDLRDAATALDKDNGVKGQQHGSGPAILRLPGGHPNEATSDPKAVPLKRSRTASKDKCELIKGKTRRRQK